MWFPLGVWFNGSAFFPVPNAGGMNFCAMAKRKAHLFT